MKKIVFIAMAAFMLSGCSKVTMSNYYNDITVEKDLASLVKQGLLTDEDISLVKNYISLWNVSTEDSLTYESLLSSAKYEKEKTERNKKIQEELDQALTVCFVKKYFTSDWQNQYLSFDLKATNNTEKNVNGFKYSVDIKDGEGKSLYSTQWNSSSVPVKAKTSKVIERFVIEYDNGDILAKIRAAELDKLQIEYHVLSIIYDDGTSLEVEE